MSRYFDFKEKVLMRSIDLVNLLKRWPPNPENERLHRELAELAKEESKREDEFNQSKRLTLP
jgi:hypothetical protein